MDIEKKKRLQRSGWAVGNATDFLQLSPEEAGFIELKPALAAGIREVRERSGLTQTEVAERLGSSQSRVAKMEAGDRSVSLDLLVKSVAARWSQPRSYRKVDSASGNEPRRIAQITKDRQICDSQLQR